MRSIVSSGYVCALYIESYSISRVSVLLRYVQICKHRSTRMRIKHVSILVLGNGEA